MWQDQVLSVLFLCHSKVIVKSSIVKVPLLLWSGFNSGKAECRVCSPRPRPSTMLIPSALDTHSCKVSWKQNSAGVVESSHSSITVEERQMALLTAAVLVTGGQSSLQSCCDWILWGFSSHRWCASCRSQWYSCAWTLLVLVLTAQL